MKTTYPSDLTDAQWACLQRHLPPDVPRRRWPRHSRRSILDATFYLLRTGCPWRGRPPGSIPADFPPRQTVYCGGAGGIAGGGAGGAAHGSGGRGGTKRAAGGEPGGADGAVRLAVTVRCRAGDGGRRRGGGKGRGMTLRREGRSHEFCGGIYRTSRTQPKHTEPARTVSRVRT
jgi:hypothetical protein